MGIILDEAIKHCEEVAEENQRVVDTGIVFNDVTIDMLYCDDTEEIEKHLANYKECAEKYGHIAEWLKDYKRLKEQELCEDAIRRQAILDMCEKEIDHINKNWQNYHSPSEAKSGFVYIAAHVQDLRPVAPQKVGRWIESKGCDDIDHFYVCSECGRYIKLNCGEKLSDYPYCHCGAKMQ